MQNHVPILFEEIPEKTLTWEKLFCSGKKITLLSKGNWLTAFIIGAMFLRPLLFTKPGTSSW